jgi:hypothetical protein
VTEKDKVQSKVEIKIGEISFSAEGDPTWLSEQVAKVIEAASKMPAASTTPVLAPLSGGAPSGAAAEFGGSLASCIKALGGENKQVRRFLATAAWLSQRGEANLKASTVAGALSANHQKGLANPNDCLNQNCAKGYCEKTKEGFFITPEGWSVLGVSK